MDAMTTLNGSTLTTLPTLVTGGAGFIGSHTVDALLERGARVRVLDDLSAGKLQNLPVEHERLEVVVGDILDYQVVREAMEGMGRCLHLAAQVSAVRSVEDPYSSALTNVLGFINVLEAACEEGVHRVVYASSAAVYGDNDNLPLSEDVPLRPINPYGVEKMVDEHYADYYRRQRALSIAGLRYFNVYGPRQDPSSPYSGVISRFIERMGSGHAPTVFGDGHQTRDFVYVKDVAEANVIALGSDYCGVCNVASSGRVDLLELIRILSQHLGVQAQPEFAEPRPGDIRHSCGDNQRLSEQLGFAAHTGLDEGLGALAAERTADVLSHRIAPKRPRRRQTPSATRARLRAR